MGDGLRIDYQDASGYEGWADEFLRPSTEQEVVGILARAAVSRTPVTVVGALTGITGAATARGGIALSTEKLTRLEIHDGFAICGPGVRLRDLQAAASATGQFFAPDPTESSASIGGAISTNASGSRSFRYGATAKHVEALRVALIDGRTLAVRRGDRVDFEIPPLKLPRTTKHSAGYRLQPELDWIDLFAGAEGTLGVVTEAEVRLLPIPKELLSGVIFFRSDAAALNAVEAWRSIVGLRMLEYCDRASLHLVGVPHEGALLIEQELTGDDLDSWADRLAEAGALESESWIAASEGDRERFRAFRHSLPETVNARVRRNGFLKVGSDYAVPFECNREMLSSSRLRLDNALPGLYVMYGHVGDGHVHVNILPETLEQFELAQELLLEFAEKAVSLGGTVAAEHGLGKRKAHLLKLMYSSSEMDAMHAVKTRLDPHWLLGPGTLFPER